MARRVERLGEQFKREIAHLLVGHVRDPRVAGVTVTSVEVSRDLTFARVWVLLSGTDEQRAETLEGLAAAAPFFRRHLSGAIRIRRVPELDFQQDRTMDQARRIDELLHEIGPVPPEVVETDEGAEVEAEESHPIDDEDDGEAQG